MKHVTLNKEQIADNKKQKKLLSDNCYLITDQSGVTLLIAIMVMSGLFLISLSLAVFTIQEIRSSRAALITEPAIAAAEGAGEQGVWAIKRTAASACASGPTTNALLGNGAASSYTISRSDATVNLKASTSFVFFLFDPCNMNNNIDLKHPLYDYQYVKIDCISGSALVNYTITRFDGSTTGISPSFGSICPPSVLPTQTSIISQVVDNAEGRMKITITPGSEDVTLKISTAQGMPNFPTVDATGCASKGVITDCDVINPELFTRRISVVIPSSALTTVTPPPPPPVTTWVLNVTNTSNGGSGTVTFGGNTCPSTCADVYLDNSSVTLTATPTGAATFGGWGGACSGSGTNTTCNLTMNADKSVTATFNGGPTVVTNAATSVTSTSATLNGSANPNGLASTGWFRYVATTSPGSCNDSFGTRIPASGGTALGSGTFAVNYSQSPSGLSPNTTYYFCAIASNANGTGFGNIVSFTTTITPTLTWTCTAGACGAATGTWNMATDPPLVLPNSGTYTINNVTGSPTITIRSAAGGGKGGNGSGVSGPVQGGGGGGGGGGAVTNGTSVNLVNGSTYTAVVGAAAGATTFVQGGTTFVSLNPGGNAFDGSGSSPGPGGTGGSCLVGSNCVNGSNGGGGGYEATGERSGDPGNYNPTGAAGGGGGGGADSGGNGGTGMEARGFGGYPGQVSPCDPDNANPCEGGTDGGSTGGVTVGGVHGDCDGWHNGAGGGGAGGGVVFPGLTTTFGQGGGGGGGSVNFGQGGGCSNGGSGAGRNGKRGVMVFYYGTVPPTIIASTSRTTASGVLTISPDKPANTVSGNIMIAAIALKPQTVVVSVPSGWNPINRVNGATNSLVTYWKLAGGSEPASYTWGFDTSVGSVATITTFSGVNTTTPVNVENGQSTVSGLTHATPSITTTVANTIILSVHVFGSSATWTPPAGMIELREEATLSVPNVSGESLEINYLYQAAAGATGIKTATASNDADSGATEIMAIQP